MPAAAVTGAVGLYSAHQSSKANDKAVDAQTQASADAIAEQRRQYDLMRGDLAPYTGAGTNALADWNKLNSGDYSGFESSPDYLYARDQAQYVSDHGAANAGDLYSGGHSLDLGREIAGIASQNLGNYRNSLYQLAGLGQASAAGVGAAGMNMADNIGGYLGNAGNAAANGYQNSADINGQLAAGLGGAFGDWYNSRPAQQAQTVSGGSGGLVGGLSGAAPSTAQAWPEMNWDNWD